MAKLLRYVCFSLGLSCCGNTQWTVHSGWYWVLPQRELSEKVRADERDWEQEQGGNWSNMAWANSARAWFGLDLTLRWPDAPQVWWRWPFRALLVHNFGLFHERDVQRAGSWARSKNCAQCVMDMRVKVRSCKHGGDYWDALNCSVWHSYEEVLIFQDEKKLVLNP